MKQKIEEIIHKIIEDGDHHAYIVFRSEPIRNIKNCEVLNFDELKIDWARDIVRQATLSSGDLRVLIVNCESINTSAQHSLLKALEDPQSNIKFVLSLPHSTHLLETIRSRCVIVNDTSSVFDSKYDTFFTLSSQKRIEMIDDVWESGKISNFLNAVETISHSNLKSDPSDENKRIIDTIYEVRSVMKEINTKNLLYNLAFA